MSSTIHIIPLIGYGTGKCLTPKPGFKYRTCQVLKYCDPFYSPVPYLHWANRHFYRLAYQDYLIRVREYNSAYQQHLK